MANGTLHRKRFLLHGANALIFFVAMTGAIVVGYVLVDRYRPFRADLTQSGTFSLAPKTRELLDRQKDDIKVTFFAVPSSSSEDAGYINQSVSDLLEEYKVRSHGHISFSVSNPLIDSESMIELGADPGSAVFQKATQKVVVQAKEIFKTGFDPMGGEGGETKFTGEEAFDSAVLRLSEGKTRVACFLSGHDELAIDNDKEDGFAVAAELLKRENLASRSVSLAGDADGAAPLDKKVMLNAPATGAALAVSDVPADCTVLVVAGPKTAISSGEADAIARYFQTGGGLVILGEPMTHSGIEGLMARFGVEMLPGIAVDPRKQLRSPTAILPTYEHHEIVDAMAAEKSPVLLVQAAGLKLGAKSDATMAITPFLSTSEGGMELVDIKDGAADPSSTKNIKGPLTLAYAIEKSIDGKKPARAVLMGDADFASNAAIQMMAKQGAPGNIDLFKNVVAYAAGATEQIGIGPKDPELRSITVSDMASLEILVSTGLLMPSAMFATGILVWLRRRHR